MYSELEITVVHPLQKDVALIRIGPVTIDNGKWVEHGDWLNNLICLDKTLSKNRPIKKKNK